MKIVKVNNKNFNDIFELTKELLNHSFFLTEPNPHLIDALANYAVSFLLCEVTHGYMMVDQNDKKIGYILYTIPNSPLMFGEEFLDLYGQNLKSYCIRNQVSGIESQIIRYEIDTIKNSILLKNEHKSLIANKAEISCLYIKPEYQGRGFSKGLMSQFFDDILFNGDLDFYLYTTNFYNYNFYEKLKMQKLSKVIYDKTNCPNFLSQKLKLPYYGMLYFGERRRIFDKKGNV